jgi:hypothetical protein
MKRYYCDKCQRVVRCRRLPDDITQNLNEKVEPGHNLLGTCRYHDSGASRNQVNDRGRVVAGFGSTRKTSASKVKTKSKKG